MEAEINDILHTKLRIAIGKNDDIHTSLCSHDAILRREYPQHFCRICHRNLNINNEPRINDYVILKNKNCFKPICLKCAKNNPDEFYLAYKKGTEILDRHFETATDWGLVTLSMEKQLKNR